MRSQGHFTMTSPPFSKKHHLPLSCPAKFAYVLLFSPYLFGKEMFFHARQTCEQQVTHFLKQIFCATITPIDKRCVLLINL